MLVHQVPTVSQIINAESPASLAHRKSEVLTNDKCFSMTIADYGLASSHAVTIGLYQLQAYWAVPRGFLGFHPGLGKNAQPYVPALKLWQKDMEISRGHPPITAIGLRRRRQMHLLVRARCQ